MRPNPQETAVWSHLLKKSLMKNFMFCAVVNDLTTCLNFKIDTNILLIGSNEAELYHQSVRGRYGFIHIQF